MLFEQPGWHHPWKSLPLSYFFQRQLNSPQSSINKEEKRGKPPCFSGEKEMDCIQWMLARWTLSCKGRLFYRWFVILHENKIKQNFERYRTSDISLLMSGDKGMLSFRLYLTPRFVVVLFPQEWIFVTITLLLIKRKFLQSSLCFSFTEKRWICKLLAK